MSDFVMMGEFHHFITKRTREPLIFLALSISISILLLEDLFHFGKIENLLCLEIELLGMLGISSVSAFIILYHVTDSFLLLIGS
jgi:hypothetical protein